MESLEFGRVEEIVGSKMAQFFARMISFLADQVIVPKLANSRLFQKMAVNSSKGVDKAQAGGKRLAQKARAYSKQTKKKKKKAKKGFNSVLAQLKEEIRKDLDKIK